MSPKNLMPWLSRDVLVERLRLNDPDLVSEIYEVALRQNETESARFALLDQKASGLLGQCGIAVTLAMGVVGLLAQFDEVRALLLGPAVIALILFVLAVGGGLASAVLALVSTLVSGRPVGVDEHAVFNEQELKAAEEAESPVAVTRYRRFLIPHLWSINQALFAANEAKARWLRLSQLLFAAFLVVASGAALLPSLIAALKSPVASPAPAVSAPVSARASLEGAVSNSHDGGISHDGGVEMNATDGGVEMNAMPGDGKKDQPPPPPPPKPVPQRPPPTSVPPQGRRVTSSKQPSRAPKPSKPPPRSR